MTNIPELIPHIDIEATLRFTVAQSGLVGDADQASEWVVVGSVLMVQQAATMDLHGVGADLPVMASPGELVARVTDPDILEQPFTVMLKPHEFRAFDKIVDARNRFMHPKPDRPALAISAVVEGLVVCAKLVRHLVVTQPVSQAVSALDARAELARLLGLYDDAVQFLTDGLSG